MWTKSFSRYTHILLVSAAVIIGAQISISLFESDFRVSIGIFWHFHVSDPFWKISDSSGHGDKCPLCFLFPYTDALASLWQLESTELFSGNVFLSGLRNPFFSLLP